MSGAGDLHRPKGGPPWRGPPWGRLVAAAVAAWLMSGMPAPAQTPRNVDRSVISMDGRPVMVDRVVTVADPEALWQRFREGLGIPVRTLESPAAADAASSSVRQAIAGSAALAYRDPAGVWSIMTLGGDIGEATRRQLLSFFPASDWTNADRFRHGFAIAAVPAADGAATSLSLMRPLAPLWPPASPDQGAPATLFGIQAPPGLSQVMLSVTGSGARANHVQILTGAISVERAGDGFHAALTAAGFEVSRPRSKNGVRLEGVRHDAVVFVFVGVDPSDSGRIQAIVNVEGEGVR